MAYNQSPYQQRPSIASASSSQHSPQQQYRQSNQYSPTQSTHSSLAPPPTNSFYVQALYAYSGVDTSSLSFRQGDVIEVLSTLASGWWDGVLCDQKVRGWFPSNYVQRISEDEAMWAREQMMGFWDTDNEMERRGSTTGRSQDDQFIGGVVGDGYGGSIRGSHDSTSYSEREQTLEDLMAEDLTSFSSGADIFSEIAAAAQAESSNRSVYDDQRDHRSLHGSLATYEDDGTGGEEDFWVPKVTQGGQLFYYNARTQETSRDMPIDGRGDGIHIPHEDYSDEIESQPPQRIVASMPPDQSEWTTKLTADGSSVYYLNERTGERSQIPPSSRPSISSSAAQPSPQNLAFPNPNIADRVSSGGASLLSAWTERTAGPGDKDTLRRISTYSDDSAVGGELDGGDRHREKDADDNSMAVSAPQSKEGRKSRQPGGAKAVSTAELIEPPPPPLINDLETLVITALQELISGVGIGELKPGEEEDAQAERDRLASLADVVVATVRTLLHAAGVLEPVVTTSSFPLPSSNEISANGDSQVPKLPTSAQLELRPATRRVTSTLSKLVLTVRSAWGLMETLDIDQILDDDDGLGEEEDVARREQEREAIIAGWAQARDSRFEHETKLKSEVLAGARDVQTHVLAFLSEFERVAGEALGGPALPRELLRTPKALQGSLRTNAAALLRPGGGFGANWRGNGFVTLPTPDSSPNLPPSDLGPDSLSYAYPSKSISLRIASLLQVDSTVLLEEATSLGDLVRTLATASSPQFQSSSTPTAKMPSRSASSSSLASAASRLSVGRNHITPTRSSDHNPPIHSLTTSDLLRASNKLQRHIATFLTKVEDIDVAASVDFELSADLPSRPGSRPDSRRSNFVSASGSVSTIADSPKESDVESILDPPTTEYRKSVQEARPLLAELEIHKQALYDISPDLLFAIQEMYMPSKGPGAFLDRQPIPGPQPLSTSPLAFFVSPVRVEYGPETILEVISDLSAAVNGLCATMTALGLIAEIQSTAPEGLRRGNVALRGSLYGGRTSPSTSSLAESGININVSIAPGGYEKPALSPSSSRLSLARTDDESAELSSHSRDSVDSDFFFSKGAPASSTSSMGLSSKTAKLFASASSGWNKRPSSGSSTSSRDPIRVNTDSVYGTSPSTCRFYALLASPSHLPPLVGLLASPSRKKDLAKILGKDAPRTLSGTRPSGPEPTWVGGQSVEDQTPTWLEPDYGPDEVSFNIDRQVRGGTLRALVIAASSHEGRGNVAFHLWVVHGD
ncbi:hypothetical protein P7C70_g6587, partial [Phenoliferia sp. Uapishka_3]